jgi:hypothetical protein
MLPSDFQDLSLMKHRTLHVTKKKKGEQGDYPSFPITYNTSKPLTAFPDSTRGFLYYHNLLRNIPTSGEVRFRITTSNDPSSFASGTDLLGLTGLPWRIRLIDIATAKRYNGLRQLLLEDDLVAAEVIQQCVRMLKAPTKTAQRSRLIFSFGQLFHLELGSLHLTVFMVTNDSCRKIIIRKPFARTSRLQPFGGQSAEKV